MSGATLGSNQTPQDKTRGDEVYAFSRILVDASINCRSWIIVA